MNKNAAVLALCLFSAALGFGAGGASASVDDEVSLPSPTAPAQTEVSDALPLDATCGDYSCDAPEDCHSCAQDCGDCCGNGQCEPPEDHDSCPQDC
ncbi:MAG: hypothetical protein AB8H86_01810 [Polyangiales bacterium]